MEDSIARLDNKRGTVMSPYRIRTRRARALRVFRVERNSGIGIELVSVRVCRCRFFFQAEDGIRDYKVTGVQTCALPILAGAAGVAVAVVHWPAMKLALRSSSGRVRVSGMESVDAGVVRGGSAHDAQVPGHELMVAQAQGLALGGLAAGVPQDLREDALPHLGHAAFAVHDQAAVDVHVFLQAPV